MTLHADHFDIHDISAFPLVRFRSDKAVAGYAEKWQREMEALLAANEKFVVLYTSHPEETHDDRKRRAVWLKGNKGELARLCRGLASVEPDATLREDFRKMAQANIRAFGVKQIVEATEAQALASLQQALAEPL